MIIKVVVAVAYRPLPAPSARFVDDPTRTPALVHGATMVHDRRSAANPAC